jgi:hypothetical protein
MSILLLLYVYMQSIALITSRRCEIIKACLIALLMKLLPLMRSESTATSSVQGIILIL